MPNRIVNVVLAATAGPYLAELGRASAATRKFGAETAAAGVQSDKAMKATAASGAATVRTLTGAQKAMVAAGAGIGLALGAAVMKAADFDAAMSKVSASTDATAADLALLRQAALDAGRDTQYSATEAADGINELAKAGVSAKDVMGGGLRGALSLAAAGQLEVGKAAEISASAMTQFNLKGSQVGHIADLLAAGANKAQGSVEDMGMALNQSGLVAAQYGLSIEESVGSLTAFASAGLTGSDAGTSFKTMLQRLTPTSKEAAKEMDKLGFSAFDSQGNFVGMAEVASRLQDSLKSLTPEQRNAAMATMFGSDAVRAANVLYAQGSEGIKSWTSEVNQQGYASQVAAKLTDNLRGDLERLGGSIDTVLIQGGSSANGALRSIVQGLESLVNIAGSVPGPVLAIGAGLAAVALAGPKINAVGQRMFMPLTSGLTSARVAAQSLPLALSVAGDAARKAGGGFAGAAAGFKAFTGASSLGSAAMGGLKGAAGGVIGMLGGPWGIALTAATAGVMAFAQHQQNAKQSADEFMATLDQQTGAMTENSAAWVKNRLAREVDPKDWAALKEAGVDFAALSEAIAAGGSRAAEAKDKFEQMRLAAYGTDLESLFQAAGNAIGYTADEVDKARELFALTGPAAKDAASPISVIRDAIGAIGDKSRLSQIGMDLLNGTITKTGEAVQATTEELDKMISALVRSGMVVLDRRSAESQFRAAIDESKTALQDVRKAAEDNARAHDAGKAAIKAAGDAAVAHAKAFDLNTAAGRANQQALDSVAHGALDLAQAIYDETGSEAAFQGSLAKSRAELVKTATRLGMSQTAANAYADSIIKIPPAKDTKVTNTAPAAKKSAQEYIGVVNGVPQAKNTKITASTGDAFAAVRGWLNWLSGLHPVVNVVAKTIGSFLPRAFGGPIPGPSHLKGVDSTLIMAAPGEHMLTAAEVDALGGHGEVYRLRAAIRSGRIPRYAGGGAIGASGGVAAGASYAAWETAILQILSRVVDPIAGLSAAATELSAATKAQVSTGNLAAAKSAAKAQYDLAVAARDALKLAQAADDRKIDARIAAAVKAGDAKSAKSLRADKKVQDAQQAELLAKANERVATTSLAKSAAEKSYAAVAEKAKEASDRLKAAQEGLARAQEEVARAAQQVSDSLSGQYRAIGGALVPSAWLEQLREGATQLAEFDDQIKALRDAGLAPGLISEIVSKGVGDGGLIAAQLLSAGDSLISDMNAASAALQKSADHLGTTVAMIGKNADGTDSWRGGLTWVGERGPELVSLPRGSAIMNSVASKRFAAAASSRVVVDPGAVGAAVARELAGASLRLTGADVLTGEMLGVLDLAGRGR